LNNNLYIDKHISSIKQRNRSNEDDQQGKKWKENKFNLTKSNVLEFCTNKGSQIQQISKNNSLENIIENYKENSQNITNLESDHQSETKQDFHLTNQFINDTGNDIYQLDFDQLSAKLATHENSKLKDFMDTNNFSCIKSSIHQENIKNFLEESKLDSFIRQIANFPNDSIHLRDHM
jgi:uncharacterized membrane protein YfhO